MISPFPGMDPYLEDPAFWSDFHLRFITSWSEVLADVLPEPYEARLNDRIQMIQVSPEVINLIYPDVALTKRPGSKPGVAWSGSIATLEPVSLLNPILEESREARIEVLRRPERTVVAILELLSPSNKAGTGWMEYAAKRTAILQQKVHLVELDLLLGGQRISLTDPLPQGDYFTFITRAEQRAFCQVYSWTVRQALPCLPIPLRAPDADVIVDLGKVIQLAYSRGRYGKVLEYELPPAVSLPEADLGWVAEIGRSVRSQPNGLAGS